MGVYEIAWAAGLFEGEGCISQPRWGERIGLSLLLTSTDRDVLDRFHRVVGCGSIRQKSMTNRPKHHKALWEWKTANRPDVLRLLRAFMPYLGKRRTTKAEKAIAEATPVLSRSDRAKQRTHCKNGHRRTRANTYISPQGHRLCRVCRRETRKRYREATGK